MACEHLNRSTSTSVSYTTKRVWDDVGKRWVELEMRTETTVERCADCGAEMSRSERTS